MSWQDEAEVMIVEDYPATLRLLTEILELRGYTVHGFTDAESAWAHVESNSVPLALVDWNLPGMSGLDLCRRMREHPNSTTSVVVVVTARTGPGDLQQVLDAGADDYLAKPIDMDLLDIRLTIAERRIVDRMTLTEAHARVAELEDRIARGEGFEGIVGSSPAMQRVFEQIDLAARSDVSVLVRGESGTGKELVARVLHERSPRSKGPFVAVNCSAIPETLLESELFGHVKGAFTGAVRTKKGLFEQADGGTLFLDEIGDVDPFTQVKLLRAIQERVIRRVGDDRPVSVDVRLVTATNRDLEALRESGAIRDDFYYRIRVFQVRLPPLRERTEDIPALAAWFLSRLAPERRPDVRGLTRSALDRLQAWSWPGNIRELQNAIEYALVVARGERIGVADLPDDVRGAGPVAGAAHPATTSSGDAATVDPVQEIIEALDASGGVRTKAAELLGISRVALWKRMKKHGIEYD